MVKNSFFLVLILGITSSLSGVSSCWFCNNTNDIIIFKNLYDEKLQKQKVPSNLAAGNITILTNIEFVFLQ